MTNEASDGLQLLRDGEQESIYDLRTQGDGPAGSLPLTDRLLRESPSGDLFALTQNAGMGWDPAKVLSKPFLILSTKKL